MRCAFSATLLAGLFMVNAAYAGNQVFVVDYKFCRAFVPHVPDPDVTYKPRQDVHGREVAPADLPGTGYGIVPEDASFYLVQNLAELAGGDWAGKYPGLKQDMILGYVELRDGVAWLNGKPLTAEQNSELVYICRKIKSEKLP